MVFSILTQMASLAPLSNQQSSLASTHTCQVGKSIFKGDPGDKGETPTRETLQSHGGLCLRLAHLDTAIFIHFSGLFRTFTLLSLNHFWRMLGAIVLLENKSPPEPQFSCRRSQIHLQDLMILFFTILPHPEWP